MRRVPLPRRRKPLRRKAFRLTPHDTGPDPVTRGLVLIRCGGRCELPGCRRPPADIHHRRPRRMGGDQRDDVNDLANLLAVCRPHHDWIHANPALAGPRGLLLPADAVPYLIPIDPTPLETR